MTYALHAIIGLLPEWPSAMRLFAVTGWRMKSGDVALPRISSRWLLEFEITSSKRLDE